MFSRNVNDTLKDSHLGWLGYPTKIYRAINATEP